MWVCAWSLLVHWGAHAHVASLHCMPLRAAHACRQGSRCWHAPQRRNPIRPETQRLGCGLWLTIMPELIIMSGLPDYDAWPAPPPQVGLGLGFWALLSDSHMRKAAVKLVRGWAGCGASVCVCLASCRPRHELCWQGRCSPEKRRPGFMPALMGGLRGSSLVLCRTPSCWWAASS